MSLKDLRISEAEHKTRIEKIRGEMRRSRIGALYLTNPTRIMYTTGFSYISTERPLALVIPMDEPLFFMVPQLEYDHIRGECTLADEVYTSPDCHGTARPIRIFASPIAESVL